MPGNRTEYIYGTSVFYVELKFSSAESVWEGNVFEGSVSSLSPCSSLLPALKTF